MEDDKNIRITNTSRSFPFELPVIRDTSDTVSFPIDHLLFESNFGMSNNNKSCDSNCSKVVEFENVNESKSEFEGANENVGQILAFFQSECCVKIQLQFCWMYLLRVSKFSS